MARMQACSDDAAQPQAGNSSDGYAGIEGDPLPCSGSAGWSPEQRGAPFQHWHQVDFGNLTRITGVLVGTPEGTRKVTKFRLQDSLTGTTFQDLTEVTELDWSGGQYSDGVIIHKLAKAVETRFVRFLVEAAEPGDDKYIGLQLDYVGCQKSSDFPPCEGQSDTPVGDDAARNRHFAVDTTNNYLYLCDYVQSRGRRLCYVSYDAAQWQRLPEYVEQVRGFDETTGRIYVSGARVGSLLWSTDGGATWFPEVESELESVAQAEGGFFPAREVPSLTPENAGFKNRAIGDWAASYDGLSLGGQLKAKWSAVACSPASSDTQPTDALLQDID